MAKTPRLDKYKALLARFFETTIVLYIIKQVSGPPTRHSLDESTLIASQRRLLNNLAFILDHTKGGDSTTSVAIEERDHCYKFWVASNEGSNKHIQDFLKNILNALKPIPTAEHRDSTKIARKCCVFAKQRIKKECQMLARNAKKCEMDIQKKVFDISDQEKESLIEWLQQVKLDGKTDPFEASQLAFTIRNDRQMQILFQLGQELILDSPQEKTRSPFLLVRHYIGRLAAHIRVAEQLVEDSSRLSELFQAANEVHLVKPPDCVPPPQADNLTTLDRILNRLLPSPDPDIREEHRSCLKEIDDNIGIEEQIHEIYAGEKVKPRVHSEIQILEMFYRDQLPYANGDPFIGTSKLACLCCKLYIQYHPAGCAVPDSHQKVYPNWGPILLPKGYNDPRYIEQRDVLNKVRDELRHIALNQIKKRQVADMRRADSATALSQSERDVREIMEDFSDIEDELLYRDGGADGFDAAPVRPEVDVDGYDDDASSGDDSDTEGGVKL